MEEEDNTKYRWKQATAALLFSVRTQTCRPYNIPVVPDELRKWNENAYLPKVVSIGPRFRGRSDVLPMEEIKFRCITSLLSRTLLSRTGFNQEEILKQCMEAVLELDAAVRTSYAEEIKLDRYDLANIMVFDGLFLLELLISGSVLDSEIPMQFTSLGEEVKKMRHILSDLMLLENQIPTIVLETLFDKLFLEPDTPSRSLIQSLALSLFGFTQDLNIESSHFNAFQFLDIAYSFVKIEWPGTKTEENGERSHASSIGIDISGEKTKERGDVQHLNCCVKTKWWETKTEEKGKRSHASSTGTEISGEKRKERGDVQHLNRCATRLEAVGITIKPISNDNSLAPLSFFNFFKFDVKFSKINGILEIPLLNITHTTEAFWRNFIAWEHHKNNLKSRSSYGTERCYIFTSSALLFNDLICCTSDVQLLKDRGVIIDHLNMSNRDLLAFFHSIARGVDSGMIDAKYSSIFDDLNTYSTRNYAKKIYILLCHYFCRILDWSYNIHKFFRRGYNFAATLVAILTVVQTGYAIAAYHFPPK